MSIEGDRIKGALSAEAQLMTSVEADLTNRTWTFKAPWFRAGAGEYLVISVLDWNRFWDDHERG